MKTARLENWTPEQESAFQQWLKEYSGRGFPVPSLLIRPYRKGFRDRKYSPAQILKHRGLLPMLA